MKNHKTSSLLIFALLAVFGITALVALRGQSQNNSASANPDSSISATQSEVNQRGVPVADYTAPLPANPQKRAKRLARGRRHNMKLQSPKDDVKRFMITEDRESSYGGFPSHAPAEPALPVARSDAVVIGEVTDAQAYLSEDKTAIYSEFTVLIGEVLKDSSPVSLVPGVSIMAERGGGKVRLPSGKVIENLFRGKLMPRVGRRHVFFLRYNEEGKDFSIITGYELRDFRVIPLDGLLENGKVVKQLAAHQQYNGADEISFLNQVREAVNASSKVPKGGGQR